MEKKIENSKPILNRTRRQLLLGAGLTPVVMTLHAAKVMAQDVGAEGPSTPLAPYSAVLIGSAGLDTNGSEDTEVKLYNQIANNGPERLTDYYGCAGSGTVGALATLASQNDDSKCGWTYSTKVSNLGWTQTYESRCLENIYQYAKAVLEIQNTAEANTFEPNLSWNSTNDPVKNLGSTINLTLHTDAENYGVHAFFKNAKAQIAFNHVNAATTYNSKVDTWNSNLSAEETKAEHIEVPST